MVQRARLRIPSFAFGLFWRAWRSGLFIAIVFLLLMFIRGPYLEPTDFDYDEGINLMKSRLVGQGYSLYSEIWSDQPPVFTIMLAGWMSLVGETVAAARWLVILFSTLLVWSLYLVLARATTPLSAVAAILFLITSDYYLRLSGAVLIGLPSIALAMLSILLLEKRRERWNLPLSAVIMALAIQTKLMIGLAVPGMLLYLWIAPQPTLASSSRERVRRTAIWLVLFIVTTLGIGLLSQSLEIEQLLNSHFGAQTRNHQPFIEASGAFLPNFGLQHLPIIILGFVGLLFAFWANRREVVIPAIWLATAVTALSFHRPLWYHHALYLTVPLVWLAGYGVEAWYRALQSAMPRDFARFRSPRFSSSCFRLARFRSLRFVALLGIAIVFSIGFWRYPAPLPQRLTDQMTFSRPLTSPPIVEQLVVDSTAAGDAGGWLFTDRPYYAFVAGRSLPPELAVFSRKRLSTGQLTSEEIVDIVLTYQPEAILLERFSYELGPELETLIERDYTLVLEAPPARYYRMRPASK